MSLVKTRIMLYSHHAVILNPTTHIRKCLYLLGSKYTQMGFKKNPRGRGTIRVPDKTYVIYGDNGQMFRIHKNQYPELIHRFHIEGVYEGSYEIIEVPDYTPPLVELKVRPGWELRSGQKNAERFVLEQTGRENNSPLLHMPTGTGKTVTSMLTAAKLNQRIGVVILATYIEKWKEDIVKYFELKPSDIAVIQGSDSLMGSVALAQSNPEKLPKVFLFSLTTLGIFHKLYDANPNNPVLEAYGCDPHELWEQLGIGIVVFDEVHQHLYGVYRTYTHLHVPKTINLSATVISKDPTIQLIHRMMFPAKSRFMEIGMKPYIGVYACAYQINNFFNNKIKTLERGGSMYSHNAFEESLMKHKYLLDQYTRMVMDLTQESYIKDRDPRDKLCVFVYTKTLARYFCEEAKRRWPELDIRTYIEEDDYKNMLDPHIRFTTIISGGTAIDVPDLRVVIMTNNIDSPRANLQARGRLRELPDRDVRFYYLYSPTIPKQLAYHEEKVRLFMGTVAYHRDKILPPLIA